jgi:hypothetical protein
VIVDGQVEFPGAAREGDRLQRFVTPVDPELDSVAARGVDSTVQPPGSPHPPGSPGHDGGAGTASIAVLSNSDWSSLSWVISLTLARPLTDLT